MSLEMNYPEPDPNMEYNIMLADRERYNTGDAKDNEE